MATSTYFNNYSKYGNTQNLYEDLVVESIRIYGVDLIYLTRKLDSVDNILNEDDLSFFNAAYHLEMYVKTVDGFAGEGDFLSKFGLQIRDQVTFTVANRTFERYVTKLDISKIRPNEGDLIYFPMNNKFFKIVHVEHESVFYQLGALNIFDLKCELFEYSNERFMTGIEMIDTFYDSYKTSHINNLEQLTDGDPISKNIFFEEEADEILDFTESDPFSEIILPPTNYSTSADSENTTVDDINISVDTE